METSQNMHSEEQQNNPIDDSSLEELSRLFEEELASMDEIPVAPVIGNKKDRLAAMLGKVNKMLTSVEKKAEENILQRYDGVETIETFAQYEEIILEDPKQMFPAVEPPENCILFSDVKEDLLITCIDGIVTTQGNRQVEDAMNMVVAIENPDISGDYIASNFTIPLTLSLVTLLIKLKRISDTTINIKIGDKLYQPDAEEFLCKTMLFPA